MFACLLVYLFICLFIVWKWLYKLFMNMLQIHLTSAGSHSRFDFKLFVKWIDQTKGD